MGGSSGGSKNPTTPTTPTTPPPTEAQPPALPPISTPAPGYNQTPTLPGTTNPVAGPTNNPYQGAPLQNQVSGAFTSGLGQYQDMANQAGLLGGFGFGNSVNAANQYNQMTGYQPFNIQGGQVAGSNLSPYMNPYQQNVIDTTMNEMNQQHAMRQQGIDDAAQAQGAFGGSRQYVQKALADKYQGQNQANVLAQLNSQNFGNAQQQRQFDINSAFQGDARNQAQNLGLYTGGVQGLQNIGQNYQALGGQFGQAGAGGLANMANMGFGFGQDLQKNDMIMGQYQQQLQQQMMDAIKNQFAGYTNQGRTGLEILMGGNQVGNTGGKTTQNNDPGALGYVGAGLNLLSLF